MTGTSGPHRRQAVAKRRDFPNSRAGEQATTVLLVDANAWTRETLAWALETTSRDLRVLRFADVSQLPRPGPYTGAVVVLLNGDGVGLDDTRVSSAIAAIHSSLPDLPVTVLSNDEDSEAILGTIERGLNGFVPVSLELQVVAHVLQFVAAGGTYLPAELLLAGLQTSATDEVPATPPASGTTPAVTVSRLTPRELWVLGLIGRGKSNNQIAHQLNTHEAVVEGHIDHAMRKLGAIN